MFMTILGVIILVVTAFVIIVAVQPSAFRISRATTISTPPEVVFPHVKDLKKWEPWSPWAKLDPSMKQTYDGPPAGVGATTAWVGNKQVGEGRMTIVESKPSELVRIRLEFLKPFTATNMAEFTFRPQGNQTAVEWSMTGERPFMFKAVCLFMNMDKMVGGDFEKGLAGLKGVVEGSR